MIHIQALKNNLKIKTNFWIKISGIVMITFANHK